MDTVGWGGGGKQLPLTVESNDQLDDSSQSLILFPPIHLLYLLSSQVLPKKHLVQLCTEIVSSWRCTNKIESKWWNQVGELS